MFTKSVKQRIVSFPYFSPSPSSFLSFLLCHFLPFPSELAALNVGHWEVRPSPPQPLSTLAPLSPWLRKNAACTALAVFYLSSSPLHVGLTSKSWRSWMRTLAGDLPNIRSFKKTLKKGQYRLHLLFLLFQSLIKSTSERYFLGEWVMFLKCCFAHSYVGGLHEHFLTNSL